LPAPVDEFGVKPENMFYNKETLRNFKRLSSLFFDEETLRKWTLPAPVDEFGVKPENMFYNKEEDRFFCLLDAPNKEAIEKHHARFGLKCEWITEVVTTA
jgi:Protein of unknown function (DUF4242)